MGVTMAAYQGVSDEWKNNTDLFNLQPYLDMLNGDLVFRPSTRATLTWWNMVVEDLKEAWNGNVSMEDACKKAAEDMNQCLAEEAQ